MLLQLKYLNICYEVESQRRFDDDVKEMTIKYDKEPTIKNCNRSNIIYNQEFTIS